MTSKVYLCGLNLQSRVTEMRELFTGTYAHAHAHADLHTPTRTHIDADTDTDTHEKRG